MNSKILKIVTALTLCLMLLATVSACGSNGTIADTDESAPATEETEVVVPETLTDTTWTADMGEDYGATVQGDEEEVPTTLTLHFTDTGAFDVVGDVSFDYELNNDGTITVSNLNVGSTTISVDVFELSYEEGTLVLNTRINGGDVTVTFEQQ